MATRKYTIHKSRLSGLWRVICHKSFNCPMMPRAKSHQVAVVLMDNHEQIWHTPSNNTTKENSNV